MNNWRKHPMMCVVGNIDSNGHVRAKAFAENKSHPEDMLAGRRWRWMVWSQEFAWLMPRTVEEHNNRNFGILSFDEHMSVWDWLFRNGYTDEKTQPNPDEG